mgnify:CR=1 FL=1
MAKSKKADKKTTASKPKAPKKASGPSKSGLVKQLKDKGLPVLEADTVASLQKRLDTWASDKGFLLRVIRLNPYMESLGMVKLPAKGHLYWLPDTEMAHKVIMSKRVVLVKRTDMNNLPDGIKIILEDPNDGSN